MATAILTSAGAAAFAGAPIIPAVKSALYSSAAQIVHSRFSGPVKAPDGPRLANLELKMPEEGSPIPVVEGFMRVTGRVIWADDIIENVDSDTSRQGGKGSPKVETTTYSYSCTFAVGIADCSLGRIRHLGRVWADDKLIDLKGGGYKYRFYKGTETQDPDPAIVAKDGTAAAYRGLCYMVFEDFDLTEFGNRIPQFSFEVFGPSGEMETLIQGVDIIPGSTEWGYEPDVIDKDDRGETEYVNAARHSTSSDWTTSLDHLQGVLPNCDTAALVVAWFGNDLRPAQCLIEPRVEAKTKDTDPRDWRAGGLSRDQATLVTQVDGGPAYGSSPDDRSVINAIKDLKARGIRTVLYPFIMMDIEKGSSLPDPSGGGATQPPYPWRGRMRIAAGGGSAASQVATLVGQAAPGDFSNNPGDPPVYSGPPEWSYRRFILHLAALARAAGGVDAFVIGSELVGLTSSTDTAGAYPFVDALVSLAADVRTMLPGAQLSYAADWSEYHSHRAGNDVYFHLDPLWASPNINFIAIDNYVPLADWRQGKDHRDHDPERGWTSIYSLDYLKANIEGGEYHDWYYASDADRDAQVRTSIQDGAHGEDWIFRQKAIRAWHGNAHHNRPNGVRSGQPTA